MTRIVTSFAACLIYLATLLAAPFCMAEAKAKEITAADYEAMPKPSERLATELSLESCPGFKIIEWKKSNFSTKTTTPDNKTLELINEFCKLAFESFPEYLKTFHGITVKPIQLNITFSFLPYHDLFDGKDFRNLNDSKYRFSKYGDECCYYGLFIHDLNHVFLRNDPFKYKNGKLVINMAFYENILHELAHVQSVKYRVRARYFDDSNAKDEKLVKEYTKYMMSKL